MNKVLLGCKELEGIQMRQSLNGKSNVTRGLCLVFTVLMMQGCWGGRPFGMGKRPFSKVPIEKPSLLTIVNDPENTPLENEYIVNSVVEGRERVEEFFKDPYLAEFGVYLFGNRRDLDRFWRTLWDMPTFYSECWMVASGTQDTLVILSPRAWREEACKHDPEKDVHVQNLITHELVHIYHDQYNRADGFEGLASINWFVEGLATYVSGQLDEGYLASPVEAIRLGIAPRRLDEAWRGKYRYSVCGSLVKYIKTRGGRALLKRLLRATSPEEIYREIGIGEGQLLKEWRAWVLKNSNQNDKIRGRKNAFNPLK